MIDRNEPLVVCDAANRFTHHGGHPKLATCINPRPVEASAPHVHSASCSIEFDPQGNKHYACGQSETVVQEASAPAAPPTLEQRITDYLASGGLFNPEHMEHDKVRELLIDCRLALAAPDAELRELRANAKKIIRQVKGWDERDYKLWSELQNLPSFGLVAGNPINPLIARDAVVQLMKKLAAAREKELEGRR